MFGTKTSGSGIGYKKRRSKLTANTTKITETTTSEMTAKCKNQAGVERGMDRVDKNLRQGESLDKDKDRTDSTTTNRQGPPDTPAGRWITRGFSVAFWLVNSHQPSPLLPR